MQGFIILAITDTENLKYITRHKILTKSREWECRSSDRVMVLACRVCQ